MIFPVRGERNKQWKITKPFQAGHPGIDIAPIPAGTKGVGCYAPQAATVVASTVGALEGNYVVLQAGNIWYYFGHFEKRLVAVGNRVAEGQQIGILGMTGPTSGPNKVTGIHTHHEVRTTRSGGQVDPEQYYKGVGEEENMAKPSEAEVRSAALTYGRNFSESEVKYYASRQWEELLNALLPAVNADRLQYLKGIGDLQRRISELEQGLGRNSVIEYISKNLK